MCNQFPDPGFLFDLNSNSGSICNRLDVLMEAGVELVFFPTSAEIERSRKFDLLLWRHFLM